MDNYSRKMAHFRAGFDAMSKGEREAMQIAINKAWNGNRDDILERIIEIAVERDRANRKRASDRETDRRRRVLVGAHVPRKLAQRARDTARARGISMYRLMVDMLEQLPEPKIIPELPDIKPLDLSEYCPEEVQIVGQFLEEKYNKADK
jgi:hypothetical protein